MRCVERKQEVPKPDLILVATRVPPEVQEAFQRLAEGERRSMSGELRRMIEERLAASPYPATPHAAHRDELDGAEFIASIEDPEVDDVPLEDLPAR